MTITIQLHNNEIDTKKQFKSVSDAISYLKSYLPTSYTFYHIGGYECLRDGTSTDATVSTIDDLKELIEDYDLDVNPSNKSFDKLLEEVSDAWAECWDDGGGSGWYE